VSVPNGTESPWTVVVIEIVPLARSVNVALPEPETSPERLTVTTGSGLSNV